MTILNAHLDGDRVVLDDPIPEGIPANARLRVIIEVPGPSNALAAIAKMAIDAPELPADYSARHDKYLYGKDR
jgi:hypothetical protein